MDEAAVSDAPISCDCGVAGPAPWKGHEMPWSPASVVAGAVVIAFAAAAAVAGLHPWVAPLIAALFVLTIAASAIALRRHGHHGTCWATRSAWTGVAAVGLPLRIAAGFPF